MEKKRPDRNYPEDAVTSPVSASRKSRTRYLIAIGITAVLVIGGWFLFNLNSGNSIGSKPSSSGGVNAADAPTLNPETVASGYSNIWDLVFPDDNTIIFSIRSGEVRGIDMDSQQQWQVMQPTNIRAEGEGGLLGLVLDTEFAKNRYVYMCYDATGTPLSVRVARFRLSADNKSATDFKDIIADIESKAGRHSGCRLRMDKTGVLWVGTGDSAIGTAAQDTKSLGGKILRIDRDGKAVSGNLTEPFDTRIYSYGHRNTQGLVLFDTPNARGAAGFSSEHGPDNNDEINWLLPGNFGWDPASSTGKYDESVSMTDLSTYPDAVEAVWSSGDSTVAVSGMAILSHEKWGTWRGRVLMSTLKGKHARLLDIDGQGKVKSDEKILAEFGRLRTVTLGPDGNVYLTTDNGSNEDKIIRIIPTP